MTFDDGILIIYGAHNLADPGEMPITGLIEKAGISTAMTISESIDTILHCRPTRQ